MTLIEAIILGLVQGATEFFPISSSAHLTIVRKLLGIEQGSQFIYFDLTCHAGTLLAMLIYLRLEIVAALRNQQMIQWLILAMLPLIPVYLCLKSIKAAMGDPLYLSYFLWITSLLLFISGKKGESPLEKSRPKWKSVLCIGFMQTLALFPGISRSGSTIGTARLLGWNWMQAAHFSFLLAIPTILGAEIVETWKWFNAPQGPISSIGWECYLSGFCGAFGMGLIAVRSVFFFYKKGNVLPFAWYCLAIGFLARWLFHAS